MRWVSAFCQINDALELQMYHDVIELRSTEDPNRWAEACRASGQPIHPFLTYAFLQTVAPLASSVFHPLIVRHHGTDVGVLPWLERRKGPFSVVNQLPFPYVGPLVPPDLTVATLRAARRRAAWTGAIKQCYEFGPGVGVDERMDAVGFEASKHRTFVVDVTDRDAMWEAIHSSARKQIGVSQRKGVVFTNIPSPTVLEDVVTAVFQGKGLSSGYRQPLALPELGGNGLEAGWSVPTLDGQPVGAQILVRYGNSAACWQGGVLPEHRSTNAGVALYWNAMCWAHERGAKTLDMVGTPDANITSFKRRFGGELLEYPSLQRGVRSVEAVRALAASARRRTEALPDLLHPRVGSAMESR